MQKIMFNDKYGLTKAVLNGSKTMTRRIVPQDVVDYYENEAEDPTLIDAAKFWVGDEVAIAQRYSELSWDSRFYEMLKKECDLLPQYELKGWDNKMFVKADLMPHRIRITDVDVQRLQDISDEDCLKEGVKRYGYRDGHCFYVVENINRYFYYVKDAFATLINKVNGKGTWESNPWVFVYSFELVR